MEQSTTAIILGLLIIICGFAVIFSIEDTTDYSNHSEWQILVETSHVTSQGLIGLMMIAFGGMFIVAGSLATIENRPDNY